MRAWHFGLSSGALVAGLLLGPARSQDRPLLIPQVEGARQGKIVGRAIACGTPQARTGAYLQAARERMLKSVGGPFTEDRYLPALAQAVDQETSLGRPSDAACETALAAFGRLEKGE